MITCSLGASENHDCPIGWIRLVSSCYYFSTSETNWSTANSTCRSLGGDLVVPRNDEENSAIIKTADQNGLNHPWIGLVRDENNTFYTVSGSKPTYTPWSKGRPNNKGGYEKCGQFLDSAGLWNDIPCNRQFNFICEYRNCKLKRYL